MKNKKVLKMILCVLISLILISPNTVEAKKACNKITTKNTCSKRGDCTWNSQKKKCANKSCTKITKKSDCDSSRCSWKNKKCIKKTKTSSTNQTTNTTTNKTNSTNNLTNMKFEFCAKTAIIWQIVGWVVLIIKIIIPLLLIILGVVDFSKAVISGKDDETKKALKILMWRGIAGVAIFFIPTIVTLFMGFIVNFKDSGAEADFNVCKTCILDPNDCDTSKDAGKN